MKRRRLFDLVAGCGFMLIGLSCHAQDSFHYRARVDTVGATGFYAIVLSPGILAKSAAGLTDLRIRDVKNGQFVPYVLKEGAPAAGGDDYQLLPDPVFRQKDSSDRHSYLELEWPEAYRIERLSMGISAPALYKRMVRIYNEEAGGGLSELALVSIDPHAGVFGIPVVKTSRLRIDIANADNSPLKISKVSSWQATVYLLSYLQGASSYDVLTGDGSAIAPEYDLNFFTDSMKREAQELKTGAILEVKPAIIATPPPIGHGGDRVAKQETVLLWGCVLVVLLFLIYFSIRMVKAVGKKDENDRL
jgi:hypothetical protein